MRRTVLIVDDHPDFRRAARRLLEAEGFAIVGEAADCTEALTAVAELAPDVVLLDVQLPHVDGFAVATRIAAVGARTAVVLISSREAETYGDRVAQAGAVGFIPKRALSGDALSSMLA